VAGHRRSDACSDGPATGAPERPTVHLISATDHLISVRASGTCLSGSPGPRVLSAGQGLLG
jgi:hypothetical protein